jgi:hypothetical protein
MVEKYLTRKAAGAYLKDTYGVFSAGTLAKFASIGGGPKYIKIGVKTLYTIEELDAWAKSKMAIHSSASTVLFSSAA